MDPKPSSFTAGGNHPKTCFLLLVLVLISYLVPPKRRHTTDLWRKLKPVNHQSQTVKHGSLHCWVWFCNNSSLHPLVQQWPDQGLHQWSQVTGQSHSSSQPTLSSNHIRPRSLSANHVPNCGHKVSPLPNEVSAHRNDPQHHNVQLRWWARNQLISWRTRTRRGGIFLE